jgi:uncharacterized protein YndB with AHSA1/START domain
MEKWVFEHSAESDAPPESVWERYTDVELWREWSKGVEESELEGEFEAGSEGQVKPPQLPRSKFELLEVEPERRFVTQAKLPVGTGKIRIEYEVEPSNGGSRITHRAKIDGPLDFLWGPAVGWMVKRELAPSVDRLAELAVEKAEQAQKEEEEKEKRQQRLQKADEHFREEIKKTAPKEGEDRGAPSLPGG